MKRLAVFLLCAMLAVPTVSMDVKATETANAQTTESTDGKTETDNGKETGLSTQTPNNETTGSSEGSDTNDTQMSEKEKLEKLRTEAFVELYDYYIVLEINEKEKAEADKAMKTAAGQLGFDYTPAPKAPNAGDFKANDKATLKSESGIANCVATTKAKLDKITTEQPKEEQPVETPAANSNIIIGGKEYDTTIANAGQQCEIAVPLVNLGDTNVTNVVITPVLSSDVTTWPFEISKTDYSQVCEKLEGENSGKDVLSRKCTFRWTLKTRADAVTGYTKLVFNVSYNEADGTKNTVALEYYVQVNGVASEETNDSGKISTPRVIVTGFTTTPEEVYAGDTFKLTLNLKNTSKTTAVSNMLFDIQGTQEGTDANNTYAAFLPTAGSSTIFVDSIAPNSTKSISIELKSKADLAQKPYVVTVNMEYEDKDANAFSETASVSVPIKQEAKVDLSSVTLMPDSVEVGNEANVMFSIYNVGKTKLYNVNVKFQADSITGGETFLGNLDPGATGNVDAYLAAQAATMDDGTVKILISYEDEEGKESVIEETMTLFVMEPYYGEVMEDPMMMGDMMEEEKGFPWWGFALIGAVVCGGGLAAGLILRKKKKAKKLAQEEMELIEILEDGETEE